MATTSQKVSADSAFVTEDWTGYFQSLKRAARSGDAQAMCDLGLWLLEGKRDAAGKWALRRSLRDGAQWLMRASETRHAGALNGLASCYDFGRGVKRDKAKALGLYRRAVRAGEENAAINVAITYRELGNLRAYRRWLKRASNSGNGEAVLQLAEWTLSHRPTTNRRKLTIRSLRKLIRRLENTPLIEQFEDELPRARELLRQATKGL